VFMEEENKRQRILAVKRFSDGESPGSICASLGKSKSWLYKWIERYLEHDDSWSENRSRRPLTGSMYTPIEIEEIVKMIRLNLYNQDMFCGAQAIHWEMEELGVRPLLSIRTINRILSRNELTHRRTGKYEAKGTIYPKLPSI
jgi:putative transposase